MRAWLWLSLALSTLPLAAWASARVADVLATAIARQAATALAAYAPHAYRREIDRAPTTVPPQREPSAEEWRVRPPAKKVRVGREAHARALAARGIRVSADMVLRLVESGARPNGARVAAFGDRPAGLILSGVGGLGIGLEDGDVLTDAGGRRASSVADVVGVVIASRARRVTEISGHFWRNGEPWNLIVEQPYAERPAGGATERQAESDTNASGRTHRTFAAASRAPTHGFARHSRNARSRFE